MASATVYTLLVTSLVVLCRLAAGCPVPQPPPAINACPPRPPFGRRPGAPLTFPSGGDLIAVSGDELHDLLMHQAWHRRPVVVFFYLAECPNSMAMLPVVQCLPAFFPPDILFVAIEYGDLSLMQLMSHTIHALPVLQVSQQGKRYRHRGSHRLEQLVSFLSRALDQEPLALPAAAALCAANATRCGGWRCRRSDGEATAEELAHAPSPLLGLSALFLAVRACLWCWRSRRRPAAAAAAPAAAAAAGQAAAGAAAGGEAGQAGAAGQAAGVVAGDRAADDNAAAAAAAAAAAPLPRLEAAAADGEG